MIYHHIPKLRGRTSFVTIIPFHRQIHTAWTIRHLLHVRHITLPTPIKIAEICMHTDHYHTPFLKSALHAFIDYQQGPANYVPLVLTPWHCWALHTIGNLIPWSVSVGCDIEGRIRHVARRTMGRVCCGHESEGSRTELWDDDGHVQRLWFEDRGYVIFSGAWRDELPR